MQYKYFITDVFTEEPFNGAQIAVFPQADDLEAEEMQLLARELNLSETVFVKNSNDKDITKRIHVYSPTQEIDFAGPPIIASAHVLASTGEINVVDDKYTDVVFEQNIGAINVSIKKSDGKSTLVQFEIKSQVVVDRYVPMEDQLAEMLSLEESEIEKLKYQTMLVSDNKPYLVIPLRSFDAVLKAKFNYAAWSHTVAPTCMAKDMLLFSTQSDIPESNFHARLLGPEIGVLEDPPIASAMPAFSGYLCAHDNLAKGRHSFVIDRGLKETRKSVLSIEMDNSETKETTVHIGGPAVTVGEGVFTINKD